MKLTEFLLGAGAGAAIVYGLIKLTQDDESKPEKETPVDHAIDFDVFQRETLTLDALKGRELSLWAADHFERNEDICIVAFPTPAVLKLFNIKNCPKDLDAKTNAIQFVIGDETSELRAARLLSFGEVSENVARLFNGEDYFIIRGDGKND